MLYPQSYPQYSTYRGPAFITDKNALKRDKKRVKSTIICTICQILLTKPGKTLYLVTIWLIFGESLQTY